MVSPVTDPELLRQLEGDSGPVADPALLAQLEGGASDQAPQYSQGFFKTYEGQPQGIMQNADVMAGKGMNLGMEALSAPFELAGEATRGAVEGMAGRKTNFRAPRIFGGKGAADPFGYANKLTRTAASGLTAPLRGQGMAQQAQAEYDRPQSGIDTAADIATGLGASFLAPRVANAPMEAVSEGMQGAGRIFSKAGKFAGKTAGDIIEKTTGIGSRNVQGLLKKPGSIFTAPTKRDVAAAYAHTEIPPEIEKSLEQIVDEGTSSYGKVVKNAGEILKAQENNPEAIVKGRQALDKQIALLNNQIDAAKGGSKSALLNARNAKYALRDAFNSFLDKIAPNFREADAVASKQLAVDPFRRIALPGKINFLSPEGAMRAIPGLPTAIGLGVSGVGAVAKTAAGAGKILGEAAKVGSKVGALGVSSNKITEFHGNKVRQNGKTYKWNGSEYVEVN